MPEATSAPTSLLGDLPRNFDRFQPVTRERPDLLLTEAVGIYGLFRAAGLLIPALWPSSWVPIIFTSIWLCLHLVVPPWRHSHEQRRFGTSLPELATWVIMPSAIQLALGASPGRALLFLELWCIAGLLVFRRLLCLHRRGYGDNVRENSRWLLLGVLGFGAIQPFLWAGELGAGDSRWYSTMLADVLAQARAGYFPFFVGQSEFQFNGAIYPLRVAPGFHYFGAAVDLFTSGCLTTAAVQNLLIAVWGFATLFSTYFSLTAILPTRRWICALLAVLFLFCPGVIGIAYNSDLFMSWMTLPFYPIVLASAVRSYTNPGWRPMVALGASLGMMWWGHSPLALWATAVVALLQLPRIFREFGRAQFWLTAAAGVAAYVAIAAYPILSVKAFPVEPGWDMTKFQPASVQNILYFIRQVYPQTFTPISAGGRALSDLQLGYSLWLLLAFGTVCALATRRLSSGILIALSWLVACLLTPALGLEGYLWNHLPGILRNPTGNWAMNRLYFILAGLLVFGVAASWPQRCNDRKIGVTILALLGLSVASLWSLREAAKFVRGAVVNRLPPERALADFRPENSIVTRFAYFVFPKNPDYFTHGATDPQIENRLLQPSGGLIASNEDAARAATRWATAQPVAFQLNGEGQLVAPINLHLIPGHRYFLDFTFGASNQLTGALRIFGPSFNHVYGLPDYGGARSFGIGGQHSHALSLWTTVPSGEDLTIVFYPENRQPLPATPSPAISIRWGEYDPGRLPVQVTSWMPYRADVTSPAPAILETPRMFQTSYEAFVDRHPVAVTKTANGLVGIPVPAGISHIRLRYHAPLGLEIAFWCSALTALGWLAGSSWLLLRRAWNAHASVEPWRLPLRRHRRVRRSHGKAPIAG